MEQTLQLMSTANLGTFKEPIGFLKLIQVIIAIFAFATTCGFSSFTAFRVNCLDNIEFKIHFSYPFKLYDIHVPKNICSDTSKETVNVWGDFSAPSQFFVFVGVVCFLYCLAAIVLYVLFDEVYRKNDRIPIIDFVVSAIIALCWLISSSAWAHGLVELKFYTYPEYLLKSDLPICKDGHFHCEVSDGGNYAGLNVSIIFGFLNLLVWSGNLWFLFKETSWFKVRSKPATDAPTDPQEV